jgi:hypothetical protein
MFQRQRSRPEALVVSFEPIVLHGLIHRPSQVRLAQRAGSGVQAFCSVMTLLQFQSNEPQASGMVKNCVLPKLFFRPYEDRDSSTVSSIPSRPSKTSPSARLSGMPGPRSDQ